VLWCYRTLTNEGFFSAEESDVMMSWHALTRIVSLHVAVLGIEREVDIDHPSENRVIWVICLGAIML
jgi:hypothetical protein